MSHRVRRPNEYRPAVEALETRCLLSTSSAALAAATTASTASVSGRVVYDEDGDHQIDPSEGGAAGWTVWVEQTGNGLLDPGEPTAVTGDDGRFRFDHLPPGQTQVNIEHRAGWWQSPNGRSAYLEPGQSREYSPFLVGQATSVHVTLNYLHRGMVISGPATAYLDLDEDRVLDPGEPASEWGDAGGWTLVVPTKGVPAGTYTLRTVVDPRYRVIEPAEGYRRVTVSLTRPIVYEHFIYTDKAAVSGTIFRDLDRDGTHDAGEPALSNQMVYSDLNRNGQFDYYAGEPYTRTDWDGRYELADLNGGTHVVRHNASPEYWVFTTPPGGAHAVTVAAPDLVSDFNFGVAPAAAAFFYDARLFYNNSAFDGNDPAAGPADAGAIDHTTRPLRPSDAAASFANVSSYTKGINGLVLEIADLAWIPGAADFEFHVGPGGDPAGWGRAPDPASITVVRPVVVASPVFQVSRITLTWGDGQVRNTWLRVTVKATHNTGLTRPAVFYFGNLVGETGTNLTGAPVTGQPGSGWRVDAADVLATRRGLSRARVGVTSRYDFNKDGLVNASDQAIVRSNQFRTLPPITPPAAAASAASPLLPPRRRAAYDLRTPD